ncbi:MAG: ribosome biogenesis GTPase Der [Bacteroidetes bacterium]|nr:ribosome biogenesis GTPase Der [Bacteroidota bacterium]
MSNVVAIIGRPNVGKSTLFNRLVGGRVAIVDSVAGVTRDRHYGKTEWNGKEFSIIDTGGYIKGSDDTFEAEIRRQVEIAIQEATVLVFVVDVVDGVTEYDKEVAKIIRRSKKPVLLTVNKVDNNERGAYAAEFYSLGLGDIYSISSISGSGTGELLDELVKRLPFDTALEEMADLPKIAILGRPNVGKSSLTNALLGTERNIVTDIAGTTRDTIHTHYKAFGHDFWLIDTAGIRRKSRVHEDLEFYSVMRALRALEDCDVVVLMIDATQGFESQDQAIFSLAEKNKKGIVIVVNKWDLVEKENNSTKKYEEQIREKIAPFRDVPIVFTSATEKQRILKAVEVAIQVYHNRSNRIATSKLNDFFLPLIENHGPPAIKGKHVKIKYVTQLKIRVPTIVFFCNLPQYINEDYKRYLENKLRENFDFSGVPLTMAFRKKS